MARPPNPEAPERLMEAARAAFAEVGVDAARIQDIAKAAGFSKAAFYLYFDSKEELFARLVGQLFAALTDVTNRRHDAFRALVARLGPCSAEDWQHGSERLDAFNRLDFEHTVLAFRVLWSHRDVVACVLDQTTGPRRALIDQFIEVTRSTLTSRLTEAMQLGFIRPDMDSELAAEIIIGIYLQLGRRMVRLAEAPDFEAWARAVDTFVAEGIGCHALAVKAPLERP